MYRRAGENPTESEVQDMINEIDLEGRGCITWEVIVLKIHLDT